MLVYREEGDPLYHWGGRGKSIGRKEKSFSQ